MAVTDKFLRNMGKFFRNVKDEEWLVKEAGKQAVGIYVIGPTGQRTKAYLKNKIFGPGKDSRGNPITVHYNDHYMCEDGYEYTEINGTVYRHNFATDSWEPADA